jgi:preprotein translocase subunit SecE
MNTQNVETVNSKTDYALVTVAIVIVLAGVLGFSFLSERPMLMRLGILFAGLAGGLAVAWFSQSGRRFIAFSRDSYDEGRRVTWPNRKETIQTTGIVFAFVAITALFLFIVDKSIEWVLYDLLLHWK